MTKSMPSISSSGNIRPASITTMSFSYSMAYIFLPISPSPPKGINFSVSAGAEAIFLLWA